jgi:nitrate reductase NapAB chaperone NapD
MSADGAHWGDAPANLSGILVVAAAERVEAVRAALEAFPGVDVHQVDRETGRMVVTQEAPDVPAEVAGLKRIQSLPDVVMAEMVVHWFEGDPQMHGPEELVDLPDGLGGEAAPARTPSPPASGVRGQG